MWNVAEKRKVDEGERREGHNKAGRRAEDMSWHEWIKDPGNHKTRSDRLTPREVLFIRAASDSAVWC